MATVAGTLQRPCALLLDDPRGKLYVACTDHLAVIDLASNAVTRSIGMADSPAAMAADTARRRICVAGALDSLYFVDADADSVLSAVALPALAAQELLALCTRNDKLYCTGPGSQWLCAVDLTTDSVVASIPVPLDPSDLLYNSRSNQVYVASHNPGLTAIDCGRDSVVATLSVYDAQDIELDTLRNRLYVCSSPPGVMAAPSHLVVVDAATLAPVIATAVGSRLSRTRWVSTRDVVYVADGEDPDVAVYDCATSVLLSRHEVGTKVAAAVWDSIDGRLFAANARSACISIIDGTTLDVVDTVAVSYGPFDLCWVPQNNTLYCTCQSDSSIWVIDGATGAVLAALPGHDMYNHMAFSVASNKLYCSHYTSLYQDSGRVTVIDGTTNAVVATVTTGPSTTRLLWYPDSNWMYCARYRSIAVIDCNSDRVVATINDVRGPTEMVYNTTNGHIYCASEEGLLVIDPAARQVLRRLPVGMVYPLTWSNRRGEVYFSVAWSGELSVLDCATDSVVTVIEYEPAGYPVAVVWNFLNDKVYLVLNSWENAVVVFDAAARQTTDTFTMRGWPSGAAWDPTTNRTFVPNWDGSSVSVLRDNPPGADDVAATRGWSRPLLPSVCRRDLPLTPDGPSTLLDATGRRVTDLRPGPNDVSRLAPGVYFVRQASGVKRQASGVTKVIIAR